MQGDTSSNGGSSGGGAAPPAPDCTGSRVARKQEDGFFGTRERERLHARVAEMSGREQRAEGPDERAPIGGNFLLIQVGT
jgi:hypothetical protein